MRGSHNKIVLYHGVTREQAGGIFNYRNKHISPEAFARQLSWFKQHCTVLPLAELVARLKDGTLPTNAVAITFDDGYANNYTAGYAALRAAGLPATFFITTGFIDGVPLGVDVIEHAIGTTALKSLTLQLGDTSSTFQLNTRKERIAADLKVRAYYKTLAPNEAAVFLQTLVAASGVSLTPTLASSPYKPLTWEQMREMEQGGMTFAAHTVTHPILARASAAEARAEIMQSHEALRSNGLHPLNIFAYPNGGRGDYSAQTISVLKEAGFVASLTTEPKALSKQNDLFALPRYTLDGTNSFNRFRLKMSGYFEPISGFLHSRLLKMLIIGGISVVLQTIIFEVLGIYWQLVSPATAAIVGGEFGLLLNFALNQRYSFKERVAHSAPLLERLARFHCVVAGSLLIQWVLITLATHYTQSTLVIHIAYVAGIILGFISNYIGYHLFVWKAAPAKTNVAH